MAGRIRVGIGGWTFEPWRGVFYPEGLSQKRELEYASRALTAIEINGTYYSTFKPESWRKWHDETPDDFVFAVKASRFCTNRKVLADAGESVAKFLDQGLTGLGPKLGPINWQFMATKKFDAADFAGVPETAAAREGRASPAPRRRGAQPELPDARLLRPGAGGRNRHRACAGRGLPTDRRDDGGLHLCPLHGDCRG